jgi:hypothetical protein
VRVSEDEAAAGWSVGLDEQVQQKIRRKRVAVRKIKINPGPVLMLWAVVVGERLGYKREETLMLANAECEE